MASNLSKYLLGYPYKNGQTFIVYLTAFQEEW